MLLLLCNSLACLNHICSVPIICLYEVFGSMANPGVSVFRLFGCYEALDGGGLEEALVDFTGGVAETIELRADNYNEDEAKRDALFEVLKKADHHKSLMAAAIPVSTAFP